MIFTGIGDEAGNSIQAQILAMKDLGWTQIEMRGVEVPGFPKANFHEIPEPAFDIAAAALQEAGISVYCFGSTIMNWAKKVSDPFEITLGEVGRAIPRMQRLGTKFVRIMSFKPADDEEIIPALCLERVREVTQRFLDAGITPVHENCMNYGGMSARHALQLLEAAPGLKWVFDTANPVFNADRSKPKPWPKQDPWEFWTAVREHTVHIHIKDATWVDAKNDADYNWPGEGRGKVRQILFDALANGYNQALSIEPHMVVVFHDAGAKANDEAMRNNFVEYGRRLQTMVAGIRSDLIDRG